MKNRTHVSHSRQKNPYDSNLVGHVQKAQKNANALEKENE